jgi:CheY-like chemotaxis protein
MNTVREEVTITTKTILLIDDEVRVREVVELCLKDLAGWTVVVADSPLQGLQKAALEKPNAIVLDLLSMNGMDGFMFLTQLRNNPETQAIPVVLLSAKVRWLDSQILRQYQVAGVILKPFDPVSLPVQIATLLGWNSTLI